MSARTSKLIVSVTAIALLLLIGRPLAPTPAAVAQGGIALPQYRELVRGVARSTWDAAPEDAPGARLAALVELDMLPLAVAGRDWDHARRAAYMGELSDAQDQAAAAIEALGGTVLARFSHASAGLAVAIDPAGARAVGELAGVAAVLRVGDYAADQTGSPASAATLAEVAALVGADEVRARGNDGSGVEIAVVDSGVDYTHVKLGGPGGAAAYGRAICGAPGLAPGDAGCADGMGAPPADLFPNAKVRGGADYVGDLWPAPDPRCPAERPVCEQPDPNPIDREGHGTHVADIAAGLPSAAGDDAGIAPGASVWAFKACNGAAGLCNGTALLAAIDAALDLDGSDRNGCRPGCLTYDPADIINISLSYRYGQPEDALALFANIAGYYGSLVVASAGNDGDKPYILGSPATAAAALAVGESTMPGAAGATLQVDGKELDALFQPWSAPLAAPASAPLRVGDGQGGNADGCAPLPGWSGALLLAGGGCTAQQKAANAAAAGAALLLIADSGRSAAPPALAGSSAALPVFSLAYVEGQRLRAAPAAVEAAPAVAGERMAPDASRGPRIADSWLKPDLAAPGAIISAVAGSGSAVAPFGGSSGSAPVVAGAAALLIEELEEVGVLDPAPGLARPPLDGGTLRLSLAPIVKALLMNTAAGDLRTQAGGLAPLTLQGAGRVSAIGAFRSRTVAVDVTAPLALINSSTELKNCTVKPFLELVAYLFWGTIPPCAALYPGGDQLYQAWNSMAGSVSFGYRPTIGYQELSRQVLVANFGRVARSYTLGTSLRFADDATRGVALDVTPATLSLPPGGSQVVTLTLKLSPLAMRDWTLNGGRLGGSGSASCDSPTPELDCPSLTLFEVDGALTISAGSLNTVSVPVHVLPRKAADVAVARVEDSAVVLSNRSRLKAGRVEAFALVDSNASLCASAAPPASCVGADNTPGSRPGIGRSPVDIALVGLRSYSAPGLNAELGLPAAPAGAAPDEVVEFAVTVFDKPYRASPNFPAQFRVHVDADRDGSDDYLVFNQDYDGGGDGRNAVFVADVNPADGTRPTLPYMFTVADFNSQNWVLPVPAAAVGLRSDRPFSWFVEAYDVYFTGTANRWDCSPACGAPPHVTQTGALRFRPVDPATAAPVLSITVSPEAQATLFFAEEPGGVAGSPSQIGLLLLHSDATPGSEASRVLLR